jgi:hypothetical protein
MAVRDEVGRSGCGARNAPALIDLSFFREKFCPYFAHFL